MAPSRRAGIRRLASLLLRFDDRDLACRNFAKGSNHVLVIGFDQRTRAFEELLGPACGSKHELETIGNLFEAVFYRDSCHRLQFSGPYWPLSTNGIARFYEEKPFLSKKPGILPIARLGADGRRKSRFGSPLTA